MRTAVPAGFESDLSSEGDYYEEKIPEKKETTVVKNSVKIPWNDIKVKNNEFKIESSNEKNEQNCASVMFEENLKKMIKLSDIEGLKLLIDDDLEKDFVFESKFSLLSFSVSNNQLKVVDFLLKSDFKDVEGSISSIIALCSNSYRTDQEKTASLKLLDLLIDNKIDLTIKSNDLNTCLHYAIKNRNIHLLPALIKNGAPLHARNKNNKTPLCLAATLGQVDTVKIIASFLTSSDADISELTEASNLTHNISIRSHLVSLINDPSKIGSEFIGEIISFDISSNNKDQLSLLLKAVGLKHLIPLFAKHTFGFKDLFQMDIKFIQNKLNLDDDEVLKLTSITKELMTNSFDKNSFFVGKKSSFNIVDVCITLSNMQDHIEFIEATMQSLCDCIQAFDITQETVLNQALVENYSHLLIKEKLLKSSLKAFGQIKEEASRRNGKKSAKSFIATSSVIVLSVGMSLGFLIYKFAIK